MEVSIARGGGRLALAPVPQAIVDRLSASVGGWSETIGPYRVKIALINNLAMGSAAHFSHDGESVTISLDWAQIERLPMVMREFKADLPWLDQKDAFLRGASRELRLYWERRNMAGGTAPITDEDRLFDGRREDDAEALAPLDNDQIEAAIRFAHFLLGHELAHLAARWSPEAVDDALYRFEEHYLRLIRRSPTLAEELFCDQQALMILLDNDVYGSAMRLNDEFSLAMAVERLQHEVRVAAPRVSALLTGRLAPERAPSFNPNRERQVLADWEYRTFQVNILLEELLERAGLDEEQRDKARTVREALYRWTSEQISEDIAGVLN